MLPARGYLQLAKGQRDAVVAALHTEQDDKVRFELVVPVTGTPVKF